MRNIIGYEIVIVCVRVQYRSHVITLIVNTKKTLSNIANIALLCNLLHNDNDNDKLGEGKVAR